MIISSLLCPARAECRTLSFELYRLGPGGVEVIDGQVFSPTHIHLATGSQDGDVRLWPTSAQTVHATSRQRVAGLAT